jgi:two-component system, NarL family, response regulator DesR
VESATTKPRLVLAQPHELFLKALADLLEEAGFDVVARCTCGDELLRCLRMHSPGIALIDTELAGSGGVTALVRDAWEAMPGGRVVLLAPALEPSLARETLASEVDGVLLKSADAQHVVAGLARIVAGDAVFPAGWLAAARVPAHDPLSERQREVLELIAQGLGNESIAQRLFISKNTVKFHVAAIYERLGVSNRVQAAARSLGAPPPPV